MIDTVEQNRRVLAKVSETLSEWRTDLGDRVQRIEGDSDRWRSILISQGGNNLRGEVEILQHENAGLAKRVAALEASVGRMVWMTVVLVVTAVLSGVGIIIGGFVLHSLGATR